MQSKIESDFWIPKSSWQTWKVSTVTSFQRESKVTKEHLKGFSAQKTLQGSSNLSLKVLQTHNSIIYNWSNHFLYSSPHANPHRLKKGWYFSLHNFCRILNSYFLQPNKLLIICSSTFLWGCMELFSNINWISSRWIGNMFLAANVRKSCLPFWGSIFIIKSIGNTGWKSFCMMLNSQVAGLCSHFSPPF